MFGSAVIILCVRGLVFCTNLPMGQADNVFMTVICIGRRRRTELRVRAACTSDGFRQQTTISRRLRGHLSSTHCEVCRHQRTAGCVRAPGSVDEITRKLRENLYLRVSVQSFDSI